LDLQPYEDPDDDLFPDLPEDQHKQAVNQLVEVRQRQLENRGLGDAQWVQRSQQRQRDNNNTKRTSPLVDPFTFLLQSSAKRQRQQPHPGLSTPLRGGADQSGFRPPNVQQPMFRDPAAQDKLADIQPPPADDRQSPSSSASDSSDKPEVIDHNPLKKLLDIFSSPPGETAQTAIVLDSGTHEAFIAGYVGVTLLPIKTGTRFYPPAIRCWPTRHQFTQRWRQPADELQTLRDGR
jgi:hypothetical protein